MVGTYPGGRCSRSYFAARAPLPCGIGGCPHRSRRVRRVDWKDVRNGSVRRLGFASRSARRRREVPANCGEARKKTRGAVDNGSHPHMGLAEDIHAGRALTIRRQFTSPGVHPFDTVEWELRDARIGHGGKVAFEQPDVEFPRSWSQNATNIVAQKYFRGQLDSPARERSVKQMIGRVAGTIADWGRARGYFATPEDGDAFEAELTYVLL